MALAKFVKIGGVWKAVSHEYVKIAGVWKAVTTNWAKVTTWKGIPFAKYLFVCEQVSDRPYMLNDTPVVGWYMPQATAWRDDKTYSINEVATYLGITYRATASSLNIPPPDASYWANAFTDPVDVAVGPQNTSYWACGNLVFKVAVDGTVDWVFTGHDTTVLSVCVDADGNVYTGDFGGTVKKISPAGGELWTKTLGANYSVYCLAVDYSAGKLYAGTGWANDAVYRLHCSNGNSTRLYTCPYGDVSGIAIDEGIPDLYIGTNAGYLLKISTGGYVYWGAGDAICSDVHNVRVGHDGFGYCATGAGGTYGKGLYKFNLSTGARIWSYSPGGTACAIGCTVDLFGNVYGTWCVPGGSTTENAVRKINSSGSLVWTWRPYLNAQMFGIATSPGAKAAGL